MKKNRLEFGDFQTPEILCEEVVRFLMASGIDPPVLVEPTCGTGNFIAASVKLFKNTQIFQGFDINSNYICELERAVAASNRKSFIFRQQDFFKMDWCDFFKSLNGDILIIGNPPWVTNSVLGTIASNNLPEKRNFQKLKGFSAKTGKANFDISEWILIKLLESMNHRSGHVAMLCKTSIARKVLKHAWTHNYCINNSSLQLFNAKEYFGVSVDACLLLIHTGKNNVEFKADIYNGLSFDNKLTTIGFQNGELVANIELYNELKDMDGICNYVWRSGVKHDAAAVMELTKEGDDFVNGLGEKYELEPKFLYPLLKSSDLANERLIPKKHILLTQMQVGDDTSEIQFSAPRTWEYIINNAAMLDRRKSIIYEKRPRFSIFGVGPYTFAPWKVAISGLYKNPTFRVLGSYNRKPIVVDDTCYFISCNSASEANFMCELLNSEICLNFLKSLVFFDAKRPINIDILNRIDLRRLADKLGRGTQARLYLQDAGIYGDKQQLLVFEKQKKYGRMKITNPKSKIENLK